MFLSTVCGQCDINGNLLYGASGKLLPWWKGSHFADKWLLPSLLSLLLESCREWCLQPAQNSGVVLRRTLILWEHLKDLHQPESAHLHNSCYVRKRKPLFTYLTVCELMLHSEGRGPNGYDPFPVLRLLTGKVREAWHAVVHGVAKSQTQLSNWKATEKVSLSKWSQSTEERVKRSRTSPDLQASHVQNFSAAWG